MAQPMTNRERFLALMEYKPIDRIPNYEVGVWTQTVDRWAEEGLNIHDLNWDWFTGEATFGLDPREYIFLHTGMMPAFDVEVLERTDEYETIRHPNGVVTKALIKGTVRGMRSSMDQHLRFPVENLEDFRALKKRYTARLGGRYSNCWREIMLPRWKRREHVLVLGQNCSTLGFYWRAREWMGTENLSMAWYLQPDLIEEMMEFTADFTIEVTRPILNEIAPDYVFINEDMSMKNGPLLSPVLYKQYIFPHMKRLVEFIKGKGVPYVIVDTDGNCEALIPLLMDAGVDAIWPMERASDMDPLDIRKKFGKSLRLWGGVDKRALTTTKKAIDEHLLSLAPLAEDGGFIPTVDHLVPPDVSLENFRYYMEHKQQLLRGEFK